MKILAREYTREFSVFVGDLKVGAITVGRNISDSLGNLYHLSVYREDGSVRRIGRANGETFCAAIHEVLKEAGYGELPGDETITIDTVEGVVP